MLRLPRVVALHSKTLQTLANQLRTTGAISSSSCHYASKTDVSTSSASDKVTDEVAADNKQELAAASLDREISLFGPVDVRAPLPGNIGMTELNPVKRQVVVDLQPDLVTNAGETIEVANEQSNYTRHYRVMEQWISLEKQEQEESNQFTSQTLECVAHECPELLIKDFQELFPVSCQFRPELTKKLTVITICQKTENDMNAWTSQVDEERGQLMEHFVVVSKQICKYLSDSGFWADFIDPSSGRPFLGEYTNATFFETDDRYRHFGFTIEDLGCCKVISHHKWGTRTFVGSIFTSAPINSKEIGEVVENSYIK